MLQNGLMRKLPVHGAAALHGDARALHDPPQRPNGRLAATGSIHHAAFRLGTIEPPSVILLKVLGPSIAVASLAACMWADGAHLSIDSLALGVMVFLISQRVLRTPECRGPRTGSRSAADVPRLLLEWSCYFAAVFLFLALRLTALVGPAP